MQDPNSDEPAPDEAANKAEFLRKKYLYRTMILKRNASLSRKAAIGLVGPDCAYHLYRHIGNASTSRSEEGEAGSPSAASSGADPGVEPQTTA